MIQSLAAVAPQSLQTNAHSWDQRLTPRSYRAWKRDLRPLHWDGWLLIDPGSSEIAPHDLLRLIAALMRATQSANLQCVAGFAETSAANGRRCFCLVHGEVDLPGFEQAIRNLHPDARISAGDLPDLEQAVHYLFDNPNVTICSGRWLFNTAALPSHNVGDRVAPAPWRRARPGLGPASAAGPAHSGPATEPVVPTPPSKTNPRRTKGDTSLRAARTNPPRNR